MRYRITESTVYEVESENAADAIHAKAKPYTVITRNVEPLPPTVEERYMKAIPHLLELLERSRVGFERQNQENGS